MFRIAELREKMGISMRKVAIELGIPYTTYISYEKETREPNSETLIKLADYFNCSIDYLVGRNDKKPDIQVEFHITDHEREYGTKVKKALQFINRGFDIKIIGEDDFMKLL